MSASLGDAYPVNIALVANETTKTNDEIDAKANKKNILISKRLLKALSQEIMLVVLLGESVLSSNLAIYIICRTQDHQQISDAEKKIPLMN